MSRILGLQAMDALGKEQAGMNGDDFNSTCSYIGCSNSTASCEACCEYTGCEMSI